MWYIIFSLIMISSWTPALQTGLTPQALAQYAREKRPEKRRCVPVIKNYFNQQLTQTEKEAVTNNNFITATEIKELEIPWLLDTIDYTQTIFGRTHLESIEKITADTAILESRQETVRFLHDNPDTLYTLQNILHTIATKQESILAYFDPSNRLNHMIEDLYYDGKSVEWLSTKAASFIKKGNNHISTLNAGIAVSIIKRSDSLFISLCKQSMADELIKIAFGMSTTLNLDAFLFDNVIDTVNGHLPWFKHFNPATYDGNHFTYSYIQQKGTWLDKIASYCCGSNAENTSVGFKYVPISWRWNIRRKTDYTTWQNVPLYKKAIAAVSLLGWMIYRDYRTIEDGKDSIKRIQMLFKTLNTLKQRVTHISDIISLIKQISDFIKKQPLFKDSEWGKELEKVDTILASKKFKELCTLLKKNTFKTDAHIVYNYGNLLKAHALLMDIQHEFVPLLKAVGELDAYCSVATLVKEHQSTPAHFSFVEFNTQNTPSMTLNHCWVPLINPQKVVTNTITMGSHAWGNKLIITGPNGGGKSTFLKQIGHSLFLAHMFGIIPASSGSLTVYHGIRTCFHPQESLSEDMSQFMVEKQCMKQLEEYIQTLPPQHNAAILIDEPYRGTVDAESGERIYTFGKKISLYPQTSVVIATHVYKPILLEKETNGIFTNCQVTINQRSSDVFERTFKVVKDVAYWWFDDAEKRSLFIDWLSFNQTFKK